MPEIGEIRLGSEIGYKHNRKHIWHACEKCGKERWVRLIGNKPVCNRCLSCSKIGNNYNWRGGRGKSGEGYFTLKLTPDDFFYPMAMKSGHVQEHRLVMAQYLQRCLLPWEIVHHKGTKHPIDSKENRGDNRIENLELVGCNGKHNKLVEKVLKGQARLIEKLQARIRELEAR